MKVAKKNIDYWRTILENMPKPYQGFMQGENNYLRKIISKDSKVLDVGCGYGRSLSDIIDITENLVGLDHDKRAVKVAKDKFKEYSTVQIIFGDAVDLPFNNNSFDFVLCMGTFSNLADRKIKALIEMKRVVRDNGKIIVSSFSESALRERLKV